MLRVVLLPTIVLASSCKGILVSDDCWVLSQPAQSCADLCGGASRVDAETTVGGATTRMVVSALEAKYGLHDTSKDSLDAPCGWPPYLAEGEVQFPEWGMVSLPPHTAHRTRHTCPAHIRAEVHRATPGSTCSSPTRTSMARAVGTASKVRPTAESRPACAALVSATRRLQAHHRPHHRTRRRRHRLLLRGSLLGRRRLRLRCGYRSRLPRLALASCKLAKPACPDAGHHPSFLGRWHWSAEVDPPLPLRRRRRHSAALERRRHGRTQPSHVPSRQPSPGSRLHRRRRPSTTCCITSLSGAQLHPPAEVREAHRAALFPLAQLRRLGR